MNRDGHIISIFGAPGSGKTTFAAPILIREVVERGRTAVVFDPQGDVVARASGQSEHGESLPPGIVKMVDDGSKVADVTQAKFSDRLTGRKPARVVSIDPSDFGHAAATMHWIAKQPWSRGWVFVFDEVEEVWGRRAPQGIERQTLKLARNRGQVLILTGQVPQETATLVRRNTTHACVFKSDSIDFVNPGCQGFGETKLFEVAHTLPKHHYAYRGPWREDPFEELPVYDAINEPIPWE